MATKSQRQLIIEALQAALQAISGTNYHYPLSSLSQVTVDPGTQILAVNPGDLPIYVIETTPDSVKHYQPAGQLLEIMRVNVHGRQDVDPLDPSQKLAAMENMKADIEVAVNVDLTLGGLVTDMRLLPPAEFVGMGSPITIVTQPIELRSYRAYGAP